MPSVESLSKIETLFHYFLVVLTLIFLKNCRIRFVCISSYRIAPLIAQSELVVDVKREPHNQHCDYIVIAHHPAFTIQVV